MRLGFSGTRHGMTDAQRAAVARLVREPRWSEFLHGCCAGADAQFAVMASDIERSGERFVYIFGYPSTFAGMTSEAALAVCDEVKQPQEALARNRMLAEDCDELVAAPDGPERLRSGTWATVRYARKLGKTVRVVMPDGTLT